MCAAKSHLRDPVTGYSSKLFKDRIPRG